MGVRTVGARDEGQELWVEGSCVGRAGQKGAWVSGVDCWVDIVG